MAKSNSPVPDSNSDIADPSNGAARQFVNGFARGLTVIRAFGEGAERLTLTQVAGRAGLTRAGARRLLLTLEELGYASHIGRQFFLTPKVLSLGYAYISSMPLWNIAQPILGQLVQDTEEPCSISVLDDAAIVYVLRIPVRRILSIGGNVGSRLPAHATSMGRILLGSLLPDQLDLVLKKSEMVSYTRRTVTDIDKLRTLIAHDHAKGYSWIEGEMEEHVCGLSVPIYDSEQKIIAALNVSFNRPRVSREAVIKKFLPLLRAAAKQMTRALSFGDRRRPP